MKKKHRVLIVDDTEMNRAMLSDMLVADYDVAEAASGKEAMEILNLQQSNIALILLDIIMPEMDGFEVLEAMNKSGLIAQIPVITISAETSSSYIDHAYDLGATDYISRPFDKKTVQRRVHNTMMLYSKQKRLEEMVTEQIAEKEKNNMLMVEILSNIVEFRNGESGLHVLHIRNLTEILLCKLQEITDQYPLTTAQQALIINASALHDIGKISIPENILNKPGKLTPEEFEIMKTHSALGAQIMGDALQRHSEELIRLAYNICRWHHERYDGKGYPDRLKGDEIPIEAQVVALADVYDALTSVRVYKPAYTHEDAMRLILHGDCGAFNPLLLRCIEEAAPYLEEKLKSSFQYPISKQNIREISTSMIAQDQASGRTLTLLDQERVKYQFFASMSNEIQFEYSYKTDILTLSEWGARQLGVPALIEHPEQSEALRRVFSEDSYRDFKQKLRHVTAQDPIVNASYFLNVHGTGRWYKATARPIWKGEYMDTRSGIIGKFTDIHEEQLELDLLKQISEQDSLTGLYHHTSAKKIIQEALQQTNLQFALVLLDLDNFKEVNDHYGHLFGDQALRYTAQKIQNHICGRDIAARIGGDEFLLFFAYKSDIMQTANALFKSFHAADESFNVSVSMGISLSSVTGTDYEALFHAAEQALHAAKNKGKNCFLFYDDSMKQEK